MMQPVRDACSSFFERFLDETNAIGINCFAELHGTQELTKKAKRFVLRKFSQVCGRKYIILGKNFLIEFISRLYNKMNGFMFQLKKLLNL
jgi:hypothetical protein